MHRLFSINYFTVLWSTAGVSIRHDLPVKLSRTLSPTLRVGELVIDDPKRTAGAGWAVRQSPCATVGQWPEGVHFRRFRHRRNPKTLLIQADGGLGTLPVSNEWRLQDVDLRIKASATESKALAEVLGYEVPELGPLAVSARLRHSDKTLTLKSGRIRIGPRKS